MTTKPRVRWAVRATLLLGVAASVTANVLHARDNPISQAIAAWPPLALLITVELMSRVPITRRAVATTRIVATAIIAGIAAWVSYWHMAGVAQRYGERPDAAHLLPLSVDGLIVVASICLVELSQIPARQVTQPQTTQAPTLPPAAPVFIEPPSAPEQPDAEPDLDADGGDDPAGQRVRQDTRTAQEIEAAVRAIKAAQPELSQRKIAAAVLVSPSTVGRILSDPKTNGRDPELAARN